jgi:hypothetical protein
MDLYQILLGRLYKLEFTTELEPQLDEALWNNYFQTRHILVCKLKQCTVELVQFQSVLIICMAVTN